MAAVTICSDFGAQENKVSHCFHCSPSIPPSWSDGANPALLYHLKIFYPSAYLRAKALCNVMIQISWLLLNTHPQSAFVPACILYVLIVHSFFFPPIDCVSFTPCSSVCFGECVSKSWPIPYWQHALQSWLHDILPRYLWHTQNNGYWEENIEDADGEAEVTWSQRLYWCSAHSEPLICWADGWMVVECMNLRVTGNWIP